MAHLTRYYMYKRIKECFKESHTINGKILGIKGWRNRIAILLCSISDKFRFMKIPETKWSIRDLIATYNEEIYPIVTWVVAKK